MSNEGTIVYVFSGLGIDERVFRNLHFPENVTVKFIPWEKPLPGETMEQYARRFALPIDRTQAVVLMGLSFGGVMALEVSKFIPAKKVILISSLVHPEHLPWYFRLAGKLQLDRLVPGKLMKQPLAIYNFFFGLKSKDDKALLREIIKDTEPVFIKWAIRSLLTWKAPKLPENLLVIHGDDDRLLPIHKESVDAIVKDGGHFMVYNKSKEVETILNKQLSD